MPLGYGEGMIHSAKQLRVSKSNSAKGTLRRTEHGAGLEATDVALDNLHLDKNGRGIEGRNVHQSLSGSGYLRASARISYVNFRNRFSQRRASASVYL